MGEVNDNRSAEGMPSEPARDEVGNEIRLRLGAATVLLAAVMALPVITSFTSLLDGLVGGIGAGYVAGFGEFVLAMAGAVVYCRWADRKGIRR
jgi:uncharacterized membrane protein (DUF485 family)